MILGLRCKANDRAGGQMGGAPAFRFFAYVHHPLEVLNRLRTAGWCDRGICKYNGAPLDARFGIGYVR